MAPLGFPSGERFLNQGCQQVMSCSLALGHTWRMVDLSGYHGSRTLFSANSSPTALLFFQVEASQGGQLARMAQKAIPLF